MGQRPGLKVAISCNQPLHWPLVQTASCTCICFIICLNEWKMRDPKFWVANRNGNVFTATANDHYIQQLTRTYKRGVRIKRIAASHWCAWAIGHDHRVYIFVLPSDVPIRVPETTYENQVKALFCHYQQYLIIIRQNQLHEVHQQEQDQFYSSTFVLNSDRDIRFN